MLPAVFKDRYFKFVALSCLFIVVLSTAAYLLTLPLSARAAGSLITLGDGVMVDGHPAHTGDLVYAGSDVSTDLKSRGKLDYGNKTFLTLSYSTTIHITKAALSDQGRLSGALFSQSSGDTFIDSSSPSLSIQGRLASMTSNQSAQFGLHQEASLETYFVISGQVTANNLSEHLAIGTTQAIDLSSASQHLFKSNLHTYIPELTNPVTWDQSSTAIDKSITSGTLSQGGGTVSFLGTVTFSYLHAGGDMSVAVSTDGNPPFFVGINFDHKKIVEQVSGGKSLSFQKSVPAGVYEIYISKLPLNSHWSVSAGSHWPCLAGRTVVNNVVRSARQASQLALKAEKEAPAVHIEHIDISDRFLHLRGGYAGQAISANVIPHPSNKDLSFEIISANIAGTSLSPDVLMNLLGYSNIKPGISYGFKISRVYSCTGPDGPLLVVEGSA